MHQAQPGTSCYVAVVLDFFYLFSNQCSPRLGNDQFDDYQHAEFLTQALVSPQCANF